MRKIRANLLLEHGFCDGILSFDQKIIDIKINAKNPHPKLPYLISGFIDLHLHGGGGHDIMEANNSYSIIAKTHARHGTTSFLATTMSDHHENLKKVFLNLKPYFENKNKNEARLLGVHLEGPFINEKKLGAQSNFCRAATLKEIYELHQIVPIKIVTLAPEIFNHQNIISEITRLGIVVQIGHSHGTYEDGVRALKNGATSFTHLFNAMTGFHHREPGISGAALAHAQYAELIPDLIHVHPGAIRAALRSIPELYFVSDAMAGAGMPDGEFKLGNDSRTVHKCPNGVRLADGTLAGSALTMDQAFLNLKELPISITEISQRMSKIPAKIVGEKNRGSIKIKYFSDFLIYDQNYNLNEVIIEGETCER